MQSFSPKKTEVLYFSKNMQNAFWIFLGGGLGSILRYFIGKWLNTYFAVLFPIGTFTVNIVGSLLIGVIYGLLQRYQLTNSAWSFFLATGFCGGFTTFSTFSFENQTLLQNGETSVAFFYTGLSVVIGIFAAWIGFKMVN